MANILRYTTAITSTLFRIGIYIFLQVIPGPPLKSILPSLYIVYLTSLWFYIPPAKSSPAPDLKPQVNGAASSQSTRHHLPHIGFTFLNRLSELLLSFPGPRRGLRVLNLTINTVLLIAATEFIIYPVYDNASGVVFTRIGAVYPDAVKVVVRYPLSNSTDTIIHIVWRPVLPEPSPWAEGPSFNLTAEHDWIDTVRLGGLWPDTGYEYTLRSSTGEELPYPLEPLRFKTFPDPRLQTSSHFRFVVSSCTTPNFPYRPLHGKRIKGFDLLADYLWPTSPASVADDNPLSESNDSLGASNNGSEVTSSVDIPPSSDLSTEFMLFLGDFIYADVPMFFGDDKEAFRRLYRRNYQSESFRKIYERLPIFHTYDDHEIINNFAGQGADLPPYVNASQAYKLYNADANYESKNGNQSYYYDFRYADTAFFVMDTRRYRSTVDSEDITSRTMLGEDQLAALYKWLSEVNNTATFKFVVTSVPFTSLWQYDARWDSWAAYPSEKAALLSAMHSVPNVVLLSGDRHEFAAIKFTGERASHDIIEISTSPLSMFSVPFVRSLRLQSDESVLQIREGHPPKEVPQEQVLEYLPAGNYKWSSIEVDTRDPDHPVAHLEVVIDGSPAYRLAIVGQPVNVKGSTAVGAIVASNLRDILDRVGIKPSRWF